MKRVLIESPYAGNVDENLKYVKAAVLDCLKRDEAPYASHLFFTQDGLLDDTNPEQRRIGIEAGLLWAEAAAYTVVYLDRGVSSGMMTGVRRAQVQGRAVHIRSLGWTTKEIFAENFQALYRAAPGKFSIDN